MNGLVSLSVLENDIQSLAQKVYTGKELDSVNAFYKEHCEIVERELYVLNILKEKNVDIRSIESLLHNKKNIDFTIKNLLWYYNEHLHNMPLTVEEIKLIVEWKGGIKNVD